MLNASRSCRAKATVSISASVGIARVNDAQTHACASELLMLADSAMYAAKQQGPGRHEVRIAATA